MGEHGKHRILLLGSMSLGLAAAMVAAADSGAVVVHEDVSPRRPRIKIDREDYPPQMPGDRRRRPGAGSPAQRLLERQRLSRAKARA